MIFKVLVVEDEEKIQELLERYLKKEGYEVYLASDGLDAIQKFNEVKPHLLLLDRMLPGISGEQVCEEVRKTSDLPVLMLTAKTEEEARIEGFELGADDYVTKPFSPREVMVRIKALLKRSYPEFGQKKVFDDGYLKVDMLLKQLWVGKREVHLTANEMSVLEVLVKNRPQPLTREQIVELTFGYDYEAYERNVDTYIKNIRHKIEPDVKKPTYVVTKYGIGYFFGG